MDALTDLHDGTFLERMSDGTCRLVVTYCGAVLWAAAAALSLFSLRLTERLDFPPSATAGAPGTWAHVFAPLVYAAVAAAGTFPAVVALAFLSAGYGAVAWALAAGAAAGAGLTAATVLPPLLAAQRWLDHPAADNGSAGVVHWALAYGASLGACALLGLCAVVLCPPARKPFRATLRCTVLGLGLLLLYDNLRRHISDPLEDPWTIVVAPYAVALLVDVALLQCFGSCVDAARKYDDSGGSCCAALYAGALPGLARMLITVSHVAFVTQAARFADGRITSGGSVAVWNWPVVAVLVAKGGLFLYFAALPSDPLFRHLDSFRTLHLKLTTGYFLADDTD